ncbi:MAG TPA: dienelactone hydrolase family protein [Acidobacteriota bacterium]|nr:dienelactone hydrolase family protein [Acidobacteriota bacterium]
MKKVFYALIVTFCISPVFSQESPKQRLEKSSRHQEWVTVKNGGRTVHSFIVYPEVKEKAAAVIVIHENRGLTDWVRSVADQVAEAGYIAIAPDLLSGMAPGGGRTSDFASEDAAREGISQLKQEQVTSDLQAVADYALKLPASNGKLAVSGFCWGGGQSFRFATNHSDLKAAFVFYGAFPHTREDLARIKSPVYGFYGGDDARINATIPETTSLMKELGKTYDPVTYDGAGHGFMRSGEEPGASEANRKARADAWERWKKLLRTI